MRRAIAARSGVQLHAAGMQQIERADIERRRHRDRAAALDQPLGEQRAGIAVIEAAVDMRRGDRHQPRGAQQPRGVGDDAHRHGARRPGAAIGDVAFGRMSVATTEDTMAWCRRQRRVLRKMAGALDGLLVVSVEQAVAAPYCSARLADAGARVIKIERPEGDFARGYDSYVHGLSRAISSGSIAASSRSRSTSRSPRTPRCCSA